MLPQTSQQHRRLFLRSNSTTYAGTQNGLISQAGIIPERVQEIYNCELYEKDRVDEGISVVVIGSLLSHCLACEARLLEIASTGAGIFLPCGIIC